MFLSARLAISVVIGGALLIPAASCGGDSGRKVTPLAEAVTEVAAERDDSVAGLDRAEHATRTLADIAGAVLPVDGGVMAGMNVMIDEFILETR